MNIIKINFEKRRGNSLDTSNPSGVNIVNSLAPAQNNNDQGIIGAGNGIIEFP